MMSSVYLSAGGIHPVCNPSWQFLQSIIEALFCLHFIDNAHFPFDTIVSSQSITELFTPMILSLIIKSGLFCLHFLYHIFLLTLQSLQYITELFILITFH